MIKKTSLVALVVVAVAAVGIARLSGGGSLSELENLRRLDHIDEGAPALVVKTRDAFVAVNENALGYLPTMAVLRIEDAVAGVALSMSEPAGETVAQNVAAAGLPSKL
jgi:hypothetical protein